MSDRTLRRPWLAALLALVVSGLGHAYLRRWARAFGWYVAVTAAVFLFVPESAIDGVLAGDPPPVRDVAPAAAVVAASVIDAYVVAHRNNREYERERDASRTSAGATAADGTTDDADAPSAETVRCPECGRESDATVDFCQWCAEPLERDAP
ncbi:zinc ribbon domain-containing protein [Halorubrum ejinorense]|uniref:Zinc ribbon domain-containing protein n=1 Tax=Halorubrum ejinorense TaxID=425309 RepID=A0AAV3SWY7_9EURY